MYKVLCHDDVIPLISTVRKTNENPGFLLVLVSPNYPEDVSTTMRWMDKIWNSCLVLWRGLPVVFSCLKIQQIQDGGQREHVKILSVYDEIVCSIWSIDRVAARAIPNVTGVPRTCPKACSKLVPERFTIVVSLGMTRESRRGVKLQKFYRPMLKQIAMHKHCCTILLLVLPHIIRYLKCWMTQVIRCQKVQSGVNGKKYWGLERL